MRFPPRNALRLLPLLAICLFCLAALAQTDSAPPPAPPLTPTHRVDQARAALDQLEKELSNRTVSDAQLAELRGKIDPIETSAKEVDAELTPVLAGIKARLDQLGAKPADNAPPESAQVTAERAEQQKRLADVDEVLKRARLIAVQADQTADHIASRRRELFTSALLQRTNSLFDANLWSDVARDLPRDFRGTDMLASDFWSNASERLTGWWRAAFAAMILALIAIYVAATGISRRVVTHEPSIEDPTRFRKVRAALWIGMVVAVVPIASVTLFFALFNGFDLIGGRLEPLVRAIITGVIRIALAAGLARALLQPSRSHWRLVDVNNSVAERLSRLAISVAAIVSVTRILEALSAVVGATLPVSVLTRVSARCLSRSQWRSRSTASSGSLKMRMSASARVSSHDATGPHPCDSPPGARSWSSSPRLLSAITRLRLLSLTRSFGLPASDRFSTSCSRSCRK